MTRKVDLGAPSLSGKDANELVAKAFAGAAYPLTVTVTNHMPRDAVFPEIEGLFLKHCSNAKGNRVTVTIDSEDQFQRLATSVEQIAELNNYKLALTVEEAVADAPVQSGSAAGTPKKSKAAAGTQNQ